MKLLTILLITFTFSFSANLLYTEQDNNRGVITYCIDDDYYYKANYIYFNDLRTNNSRSLNTKTLQKIVIISGYEIDSSKNCIFEESNFLGLTYEQYNYSMALYGIFLSFLISIAFILVV